MKKIAYFILGVIILAAIANAFKDPEKVTDEKEEAPSYLVDINKIAGNSLPDVEKELGKSKFIEKASPGKTPRRDCPKYSFKNGEIEVIFINNKADWITIENMGDTPYQNCSINVLGDFKCINRTFKNDDVMRWNNIPGFKEITFWRLYGQDGEKTNKIDNTYIKVSTD